MEENGTKITKVTKVTKVTNMANVQKAINAAKATAAIKKHGMKLALALVLVLAGCGNNATPDHNAHGGSNQADHESNGGNGGHEHMDHSGSGGLPAGMKDAANPAFKVGSQAVLRADHMPGMDGRVATIAGAYATTVYAVSYTPTNGGARVTNHKWVVHEELQGAGEAAYKPGDKVVLQAEHMKGMNGAEATIDSAEATTVYMVNYKTAAGEEVTNHLWVTESELAVE